MIHPYKTSSELLFLPIFGILVFEINNIKLFHNLITFDKASLSNRIHQLTYSISPKTKFELQRL